MDSNAPRPENPPEIPREQNSQTNPVSPLGTLLVLPFPEEGNPSPSFWRYFLRDLSFLLPIAGVVVGILFALGQAPFLGAGLTSACLLILVFRAHSAYEEFLERRRVAALEKWYRNYVEEKQQSLSENTDKQ